MRDSANVLNSLAGHSQDPNYKFERLYRLLFNENLYALAYQKLSQNAGNYTKGTDGQTIDGMSIKHIHSIIGQLKDESYRPCPARRIYIPKKNGKQRPLGIPAFKDKLVQEVVRMILESIYEGHFEDCSHGFRPHRGCHTAMASLQKGGTGARWFIEGDIKGFFDNINHDVLIGILQTVASLPLVVNYKGQEYHATLTMPEGALLAGNNYTYTVKVRNKVLEVSEATIAKWNDIDGGDVGADL